MGSTSPAEVRSQRVTPDRLTDERGALTQQLDLHRATQQARALVAAGGLDDVAITPWGAQANLRAILVHLLQETARHNGHADLVREAIDGRTGH